MRKFIATIALLITLIGTFAPVVFSVNGLQKNIASAATTVLFGKPISIKEVSNKPDYYQLETTIQYDTAAFSAGTKYNGFNHFGAASERDPHFQVINTTTGTTVIDEAVTEPEKLGLEDERYGPLRQDVKITTPGKYEAWFYEDYINGNDLLSSKIKFEITTDKKAINAQISQTTINVRGDDQIGFTPVTGVITEGSTTAKFSVGVTYKNETKQTTDDVEENLYWFLKDESGTLIKENAIDLNSKPKYNTLREFTVDISNLELGKKYTITFLDKNFVSTQGRFKSSQDFPFTAGTPIDNAAVQQQIQQQNADNALADLQNANGKDGTDSKDGLNCSLWKMDLFCYLVKFTVYITTFVPNIIATVSGLLSDFFLKFAMDPKMYGLNYTEGLGSMIHGAWSIVRDFANIGFIFALFVAAFMLILNRTEINNVQFEPKKVVVRVVIMALLVNFSLMFCRLIIQSADVFSHILYNKIVVDVKGDTTVSNFLKSVGVKSVSFGLITNTNPQQLFMNQGVSKDDPGSYTAYLAIGFITFFIYLIYIYLFVSMMFIWMGRIFGAWIAMILSPIAFVSWAIPFIENDKHIGFTNWLENFVKLAFLVPIYLFFVYISVTVLNLQNLTNGINDPDAGWMFSVIVIIIKVLLPLFAATFILMKGKTIAYDMSGEIGKVAGKVTGMATSLALGAATGGTAMLGRQTLGRAGSALANSDRLTKAQAEGGLGGFGAGLLRKGGKSVGAATFDVRNNETAMKGFGKFTGAAGEKIDLGNRALQKEGGFVKEGTVGQQIEGFKQNVSDKIAKSQLEAINDLKLNAQAKQEVEIKQAETEKQRAEENLAHEQSKQNTATTGFRNDADFALNLQKETEKERMELEDKSDDIHKEVQEQEQEVQKLAQEMANKQPHQITDEERKTYEGKVKDLEDKKQQQQLILKALASIDAHTKANTDVMEDMKGKGYTSIAQMERDKVSLEASAKTSSEKIQLESAEKAVKEKEDKIEELQTQFKKAQKIGNTAEVARLKAEIDKEKQELAKVGGLQEKLDKAKTAYNTKFGDKIKQINKDLKDYTKTLKDTEYNQTKVQLLTHEVSIKARHVAEKTFDKDHRNKEMEIAYVKRIEDVSKSDSQLRKNVGLFSMGRFGGENLNNAGTRVATDVRNNWRK